MDVEFARYGGLDLVKKLAELGGSVVSLAFTRSHSLIDASWTNARKLAASLS
ncbi:hypothetical protein [Bradyrhizobium sp. CCBAU 51745]|uniref:hypothetical protein n=1 Tax=Bradyrhizobium sp. CCBAU 51745 TaxID=1325099 RepID=UPI0023060102|nr:hypothetical protein [Bradyrhizobium sp. CCBAU 51745]